MADAFPVSGQIDPKAFPFLVVHLHRGSATGSLKVEGPSYHKALYFRGGRVLFGSSNDPRDQLGAILIEDGKITPEQLEDVNGKVGPGNPLAKVLSDTGFVSPRELSEAARAKVERILCDVLAYTTGAFEFEDGVLPKGAVDLKLSTERLVMSAVRRVSDRNFVLRHIGGLDAILGPTADMVPRLGEIEAETGGLAPHLDGRRTLKEAAASTRLEEFEAAKIACGLLFLGLVERVPATVNASPVETVTFADVDADDDAGRELDLGATAAQAIAQEPSLAAPVVEPEPAATPPPHDEPVPFAADEGQEAAPSFADVAAEPSGIGFADTTIAESWAEATMADSTVAASPEPAPPPAAAAPAVALEQPVSAPAVAAPSPSWDEPPAIEATPSAEEPETLVLAGSGPTVSETSPELPPTIRAPAPVVPPPPPPSRPRATASPRAEATPSARPSHPSKADLAAVDELLHAPSLEGPLAPLEKPTSRPPDRSPQFARSAGGRRGGSSPRAPLFLAVAAVLLGLAAAGWFYFGRPPARRGGVAAATPAPRAASPTVMPSTAPSPAALPSLAASASSAPVAPSLPPSPVAGVAATARATSPPPTTPTAVARPAAASATPDGRALLRAGSYPEAARAFVSSTRAAGKGAALIQILIACSTETVQKAVASASSPELFILPVNFKGRDCYRLCWGPYPSEGRASAAMRSLPAYFREGGATPKVLGASEALP